MYTATWLQMATASGLVGIAAGVLSVFVVLRRWAFLGEGISHSGFGGVGTALLISIAIPSLNNPAAVFAVAAAFALITAMAMAWNSHRSTVSGDASIGIFVAVTLAWGFIAFGIHQKLGRGGSGGWENYLVGDIRQLSPATMLLCCAVSIAVLLVVGALRRQFLLYCFDPMLAEVSGVSIGLVHYLLILLVALVIIVGMPMEGMLLVPALLVLPGVTGLALSRDLKFVMICSVTSALIAAIVGLLIAQKWPFIPPGPAIIMVLFVQYLAAHLRGRFREASNTM